ncbi:YgdI/YgdR family lipoprotein [Pseudomonas lalucatii]|uniref:YgdI/YgdR family lipoprotein n=1 Tax=Pseudomonas lalucatii TaxID=1424203 RepID=A0ABS5PXR5_9PSED|nr:YgdI/YgdR family lipoprotein [Pseudomonas lalucatii]MBS7661271.1 YgdI/YgdR family lipoprotein [Pseudomonas lalucatii]MBS7691702.1 YgdI/YgdR family lipoprotein [Pseudomonas lalucatii]MBS7724189.1 YgdI/YgdR family lipoprotein [Pseudomonas lalucatii]QVM87810.1 YgdI/YgdR family lipoprotein [Pseudomonas lalucatii]
MARRTIPAILLTLGLVTLAGCAAPSVITLNDGRELQTLDQPRYDEASGFYEFEQLDGTRAKVNKDQVQTIHEL